MPGLVLPLYLSCVHCKKVWTDASLRAERSNLPRFAPKGDCFVAQNAPRNDGSANTVFLQWAFAILGSVLCDEE
jgi:hypothetical protein